MREIKRYQKSTKLLIPKMPFQRVVREIAQETRTETRFTASSLEALHEAAESFLCDLFTNSTRYMAHAKRVTLMDDDWKLGLQQVNQVMIASKYGPGSVH
jgi:histone H3